MQRPGDTTNGLCHCSGSTPRARFTSAQCGCNTPEAVSVGPSPSVTAGSIREASACPRMTRHIPFARNSERLVMQILNALSGDRAGNTEELRRNLLNSGTRVVFPAGLILLLVSATYSPVPALACVQPPSVIWGSLTFT